MIMLLVVVLGLLPLPFFGGRISALGELPLRAATLLFCSVGTQLLITSVVHPPAWVGRGLHMATYLLVIPFFWLNRRLLGLWLVFAGAAMNMAAIFANGGVMPASAEAVRTAGIHFDEAFENSAPVDGALLWYLGDIFAVPAAVPLANVFSIGDVAIVTGALVLVYRSCGASWPTRPTRPTRTTRTTRNAATITVAPLDGPGGPVAPPPRTAER